MLTQEDDVEIHALARRGWSVSAIARHTGRDRKTIGRYLAGKGPKREPAASCLSGLQGSRRKLKLLAVVRRQAKVAMVESVEALVLKVGEGDKSPLGFGHLGVVHQ